jgi:H+-transporting ATPase
MAVMEKNIDYAKRTVDEVLTDLRSDRKNGLSGEEAKTRVSEFGYNEIPEKEESVFHRVFRRFWGPIPWMIEVAAVLSAVVRKWDDFVIITVLLITNAFIDFWQESKALNALKVLKEKIARRALVLRDGTFQTVDARDLVPGDIIKVKIGDLVPADVKLAEGEFLLADQSALTGESLPVSKKTGDIAYSNSIVRQGEMLAVVVATGLKTFFGKTAALVARAQKEEKSHFQKAVIHIGNYLIIITICLAVIILINAMFRHEHMVEILRFALVLAVAAIPVALPAVLTVTMAVGATHLARKQAIVSRLVSIEELAGVDVLCSDKTGTLTQNRMTVADPVPFGQGGAGELMLSAVLASREENADPIEVPLFEYFRTSGGTDDFDGYRQKSFVPFDPVRKRTEAVVTDGKETLVVTKGTPHVILDLCGKGTDEQRVTDTVEDLAGKGFRTLAVARKKYGEEKFTLAGLIPLFDPPREDSVQTIKEAGKLGVDVKMITGDNIAIARYIADILNIDKNILNARDLKGASSRELVLLGEIIAKAIYRKISPDTGEHQTEQFSREVVEEIEREYENIKIPEGYVKKHESEIIGVIEDAGGFAQVFPEDKYTIVEKLQKSGHIVAMTGDGVNDAPALKKADAGIAVSGATDAARAAADLVLLSPGLSVIVDAIKGARVTFERMRSYSVFRVAETVRIILFMTASILIFNFYPVTAVMIIILAFLNDVPILAIAYDNTKVDNQPVRWDMTEVLTLATVLGISGVASSFGIFYIAEAYMKLPPEVVQSFIFLKLVIAGHSTIYVTRTEKHFWQKPYPSPLLFSATFITEIIGTLFAVYGIFLNPIGWKYAFIIWSYALAWFVINDFIKIWTWKVLKREKLII